MNVARFIALRYIFGKRSRNVITVITFISILGITTGVAAIIIVMSVFNGFRDFTENQMLKNDPHIRVLPEKGNILKYDIALLDFIKSDISIVSFAPISKKRVAILHKGNMQIAQLMAFDSSAGNYLNDFKSFIALGKFTFDNDNSNNGVIVGAAVANKLGLYPGDTLSLLSPEMIEISIAGYRKPKPIIAIVNGVYQTNNPKYDDNTILAAKDILNKVSLKNEFANFIDIKIKDPYRHYDLQKGIENKFVHLRTQSWKELNKELYNVMKFEQLAAFVILSIIILIAVFNVLASLTMSVIDKQADIAMLKVIGLTNENIKTIFINVGLFSGIISTFSGTVLGLGFCYGQIYFKWFKVDTSKFMIDSIPVKPDYFYVLTVIIVSLLLSAIATIYPSKRATGINIINAMRSE